MASKKGILGILIGGGVLAASIYGLCKKDKKEDVVDAEYDDVTEDLEAEAVVDETEI